MIWLVYGASTLIALYILLLLGIAWLSLHPVRTPIFFSPGALGLDQEDVEFASTDGTKLRGWLMKTPETKIVLVLSHGYLMTRSELAPLATLMAEEGCSALMFDFRCHGKSAGRKCGLGWIEREDVQAAVGFSKGRFPEAKTVLIGSSMGAAASAFAMSEDPTLADALVLDSAYSRLPQAISGWWRFVGGRALSWLFSPSVIVAAPIAGFNPFKPDVAKALREIDKPVLVLHGERDNLATPEEARRNLDACKNGSIVWFARCGHSEGRWEQPEAYNEAVRAFLRRL